MLSPTLQPFASPPPRQFRALRPQEVEKRIVLWRSFDCSTEKTAALLPFFTLCGISSGAGFSAECLRFTSKATLLLDRKQSFLDQIANHQRKTHLVESLEIPARRSPFRAARLLPIPIKTLLIVVEWLAQRKRAALTMKQPCSPRADLEWIPSHFKCFEIFNFLVSSQNDADE